MNTLEDRRVDLQSSIDRSKSTEDRRRLGQFSTPTKLAREIASYSDALVDARIDFLEPAFGTGSFYSALLGCSTKEINSALAFEVDPDYCIPAMDLWKNHQIQIKNEDFLEQIPSSKYNLLICNPPYTRHHSIPPAVKKNLKKRLKGTLSIDVSGYSGLYCYFMLHCHGWLADGAISAWLIPSEFMDVGYGDVVKDYLLNDVNLLRIHRFNPEDVQFDDALVSSAVVWFKNEKPKEEHLVTFSYGGTLDEPEITKEMPTSALRSEKKWTRFPQKEKRSAVKDQTLSVYFTVKRGIATGNNNFFIMSVDEASRLGLSNEYLVPIVPSPRHMKEEVIETTTSGYPSNIQQLVLLSCDDDLDTIQKKSIPTYDYLRSDPGVSEKYLCRHRKIWYTQEKREPSPILCSYMGRGTKSPFRFILNKSEAIATNSYMMLYPTEEFEKLFGKGEKSIEKAWQYLKMNSDRLMDEGRIYGGGLEKIEPREMMSVEMMGFEDYMISKEP